MNIHRLMLDSPNGAAKGNFQFCGKHAARNVTQLIDRIGKNGLAFVSTRNRPLTVQVIPSM